MSSTAVLFFHHINESLYPDHLLQNNHRPSYSQGSIFDCLPLQWSIEEAVVLMKIEIGQLCRQHFQRGEHCERSFPQPLA